MMCDRPSCLLVLAMALLPTVVGCGKPADLALGGDSASARASLSSALDAWKGGRSPDELKNGIPAVWVSDEDWRAGHLLADFTIDEEPLPNGTTWRVFANLTLEINGKRRPAQRVCYDVTLGKGSTVSIARSDFLN